MFCVTIIVIPFIERPYNDVHGKFQPKCLYSKALLNVCWHNSNIDLSNSFAWSKTNIFEVRNSNSLSDRRTVEIATRRQQHRISVMRSIAKWVEMQSLLYSTNMLGLNNEHNQVNLIGPASFRWLCYNWLLQFKQNIESSRMLVLTWTIVKFEEIIAT